MNRRILAAFNMLTLISSFCLLLSCGENPATPPEPDPEVMILCVTLDATDVDVTSAKLRGSASIIDAKDPCAQAFFYYSNKYSDIVSLKAGGKKIKCNSISPSGGEFVSGAVGLLSSTTYYFVAGVSIDGVEEFGSVKEFSTGAVKVNLSAEPASNLGMFTGTLNGTVSVENAGLAASSVNFYYKLGECSAETLKSEGYNKPCALGNDGRFSVALTGLNRNAVYSYIACAKVADCEFTSETITFTTKDDRDYGEAVDLGLSVKWRSCNLGAMAPEGYGDYYGWGETETYYQDGQAQFSNPSWKPGKEKYYEFATNKWFKIEQNDTTILKYNTDPAYGEVDNKLTLDPEDDVAIVKLGDGWRMPTLAEIRELCNTDNCGWELVTRNGSKCYLVTSKKPGFTDKSILLPLAGHRTGKYIIGFESESNLWSSSLSKARNANCTKGTLEEGLRVGTNYRKYGQSIRPVQDR